MNAAEETPVLLPGTPYRLIRKIGAGGMGTVYLAEHIELGRLEALKLLPPHLGEDKQAMERLRREARATAQLGNQHIIDIYNLGVSADGRPFVSMRLITGRSLRELMDRETKLSASRAWAILRQVSAALRDAHDAGVIHRDLKPENVMIESREGAEFAVILDFGIARTLGETDSRLTQDGQVVGTPGYMAPEQALGREVDGRADQYSVAVLLYEMVSGGFPYERLGALQVIAQQITQRPKPLSELVSPNEVPHVLQRIVMRSLSREPEDRCLDMATFISAVDAALLPTGFVPPLFTAELEAASGAASRAPSPVRFWAPSPMTLAVAAVAAVLGIGLVAFFLGGEKIAATAVATTGLQGETPPSVTTEAATAAAAVVASTPPVASAQPTAAPAVDSMPPVAAAPAVASAPPTAPRARAFTASLPSSASEPPAPTSATVVESQAPPPPPASVAAIAALLPATSAPPPPTAAPALVRPRLVFETAKIVGGGSSRSLQVAMNAAQTLIRRCAERSTELTAGATAMAEFFIDEDGFFVTPTGKGEPRLVACAIDAIKGTAKLDRRPDTGGIRVSVVMRMEQP